MSKKKKRGRDGGAPEPGYALPTPPPEKRSPKRPPSKGMTIDAILAQLASMKDNAKSSIGCVDPEGDAIWQTDVDACEAAAAILSALQDEGLNDPEQVRDMIYDYRALAEQYQTMRQHYIEPAKPERLGTLPFTVICPKCHRQVKPANSNYCQNCGKRLGWRRRWMKEPWIVFYFQGKEVCAITVHGTFPGEIDATKEQLAAENGCDPGEITTEIVNR